VSNGHLVFSYVVLIVFAKRSNASPSWHENLYLLPSYCTIFCAGTFLFLRFFSKKYIRNGDPPPPVEEDMNDDRNLVRARGHHVMTTEARLVRQKFVEFFKTFV
jgi:hypothetical protein